ncbi:hypothetical protein AB1Y20_012185 [Prymnesium parvum]|uniref:HMG box domain-containing protein n=1 Tax=Prymnesium parvum TaxID=97485 RepID=A0AB34IND2_PRYPA
MDLHVEKAVAEDELNGAYDVDTGNELPTRGLSDCVVVEELESGMELRDLEVLDGEQPARIVVFGRLARLSEDGAPVPPTAESAASTDLGAHGGAPLPAEEDARAVESGPLVRLEVKEWSVEYDELAVTVWVSTARADYKLLSAAPPYEALWRTLQRKTVVAARAIGLLSEDPTPTFKQLAKSILRLNAIPGGVQLRADDIHAHAAFLAEQISNTEGLAECKALSGLQQELRRRSAGSQPAEQRERVDEEESALSPGAAEGAANGKRQRKPPTSLLSELEQSEGSKRAKASPKPKSKEDGKKDANAPRPAQSAFMYFSKVARAEVLAAADTTLSFTEIGRLVAERWKVADAEDKAMHEATAAADKERYAFEVQWHQEEVEALEKARARKKTGGRQNGMLACERESPKRRGGDEAEAAPSKEESKRKGPTFPTDEHVLLEREKAHRQMLLASGRAKPSDGSVTQPAYIYPPLQGYPAVLPPMPEMPPADPLVPPAGLPQSSVPQLLMVWDALCTLGMAYKLLPLSVPLHAFMSGIACTDAVDYALISSLHSSMMKAIARDVDGLDGWGPWTKALREPLLPLLWPALLSQLLEVDPFFEELYDTCNRDEIVEALNTTEWPALRPELRLQLLVWLADGVTQCETVRSHLDKCVEISAEVRREQRVLLEEESAQACVLAEAQLRAKAQEDKLVKLQEQQKQLMERKKSSAKSLDAAAQAVEAGIRGVADEQAHVNAELAVLGSISKRRREKQLLLDSMSIRGEFVGCDRYGRMYAPLGGRCGEELLLMRGEDGSWEQIRGRGNVRQLFCALHPHGEREGVLRQALKRGPHAAVVDGEDGDAAAAAEASSRAADTRTAAPAAKAPPPLYAPRPLGAHPEGAAPNGSAGDAQRGAVRARLLGLAAAIDRGAAADSALLRGASDALANLAQPDRVAAVPALPHCLAPQIEMLRVAVREFEARLHAAGQVWVESKLLQQPWQAFVRSSELPVEFAHALLVLDAYMAPSVRSRSWGQERSGRWRRQIVQSTTIASVAQHLLLLDECCAWDYVERQLNDPKKVGPGVTKAARGAPHVRAKMGVLEFAAAMGERMAVLEWCEHSPGTEVLRASAGGDLFTLTPLEGGGWRWSCCGKHEPVHALNLRGLTPAEAKGAKLTVWYEEADRDGNVVDMPYTGVVLSVHMREGMIVQFDHSLTADGTPEELVIGNEDDWMWGLHRNKASKLPRTAGH